MSAGVLYLEIVCFARFQRKQTTEEEEEDEEDKKEDVLKVGAICRWHFMLIK